MYLIEGLEDGRIAVYLKIHHALVDGISGMKLLLKSMAASAAASRKLPPPWEVETRKSRGQPLPVPTPAADSVPALRKLAREGVKSIAPVVRELRSTYGDAREGHPDLAMIGDSPQTVFNQKVSASRRFAAQSYSTPRMRAVAQSCDATLNDVVLTMCAGALRRYLGDLGELPDKSLTAAVPVSIRRPGSDAGNEVAFTLTTLATDVKDPAARLRAVKRGMDYNKERLRKLSPGQTLAYTAAIMIPGQLNSLLGRAKDSALANVVISHVPGPRQTMYWQGAKLSGIYPASLNIDGGALNITLVSRHDFVDIGLIACRKAVPSVQRLLDYLEDELAALEAGVAASGRQPAARKKKSGKSGAPRRASGRAASGKRRARSSAK
jgi:diacylglycerol O-acyltransferase